ncbi:D-galactosyl-beta-1-4-L-rhamnose phosphorylase [Verrucomicrobia bacterium IMCC26134]|nr:D-galactosyl-beta-1-4-L-rhamnose phosphorylase [Verrucomicrobia bacterium IMCC26134]
MAKPTSLTTGSFTLPGEAGYEKLTLDLAKKWGADTIRDSDGTQLSPEILQAGYDIYSTVCLVRSVQPWARENLAKLQQNFLMSFPLVADKPTLVVELLKGYFNEQFVVNAEDDPKKWWQVFDRTTGKEVPKTQWSFEAKKGTVKITGAVAGHNYTVNFLAFRIWEEISMYNHITNNWGDREHLAAVDPMHPETQKVILAFLDQWLKEHPDTTVVRFTSMFYNFSWFWGSDQKTLRDVYSDWADYEMTVSPRALTLFAKKFGYKLTSEDFVNGGLYNSTHNAPSRRYRDYMEFIHDFVIEFGRKCIDLTHKYQKKAYVFYDDHWVGVEPNSSRFKEFGFDGLIKCVFNAFEVRLCSHSQGVDVHELRLHPYLFPTGLKGEPTFKAGGNPTLDAKNFWIDARRGILRAPIDRIGLGGYLSLVQSFPDFQDYIAGLTNEFRLLKSFHADGAPYVAPFKIAILSSWGNLRAWVSSGHFIPGLDYIELVESLAGLPLDVVFLSFDDLRQKGVPKDVKVLVNAGRAGSAWSGGHEWEDPEVSALITRWVQKGGGFIGIAEPSASATPGQLFRLSHLLGLDRDRGERLANGKYKFTVSTEPHFITADLEAPLDLGKDVDGVYVFGPETQVLVAKDNSPRLTTHAFGKGRSVYLSGHKFAYQNTRLIHRALHWAAHQEAGFATWNSSNIRTESAFFAKQKKLVVINNSGEPQKTVVQDARGKAIKVSVKAHDIAILDA